MIRAILLPFKHERMCVRSWTAQGPDPCVSLLWRIKENFCFVLRKKLLVIFVFWRASNAHKLRCWELHPSSAGSRTSTELAGHEMAIRRNLAPSSRKPTNEISTQTRRSITVALPAGTSTDLASADISVGFLGVEMKTKLSGPCFLLSALEFFSPNGAVSKRMETLTNSRLA